MAEQAESHPEAATEAATEAAARPAKKGAAESRSAEWAWSRGGRVSVSPSGDSSYVSSEGSQLPSPVEVPCDASTHKA